MVTLNISSHMGERSNNFMQITQKIAIILASLITFASLAGNVNGAAVITYTQSGDSVVASISGTLAEPNEIFRSGSTVANPHLWFGVALVGATDAWRISPANVTTGAFQGPSSLTHADSFTGARVGLNANGAFLWANETPWDSALNSTAIWNSTTLLELALNFRDDVTISYETIAGGTDTLRARVVPEPSSIFLIGLGTLGIIGSRKRVNSAEQNPSDK